MGVQIKPQCESCRYFVINTLSPFKLGKVIDCQIKHKNKGLCSGYKPCGKHECENEETHTQEKEINIANIAVYCVKFTR